MTRWWRASAAVVLIVVASGCAGAYYQDTYVRASASSYSPGSTVSVSYFYDEMAPYGRWIDYQPYGWCWTPYDVSADWRPYTAGSWVYTDVGWTWASSEPWGWAAYHYGRWTFDPAYGWVWVPGTTWGPAWVAWYGNDDCVGWAPLSPGMDISVSLRYADVERIPAQQWCFVQRQHFLDGNLRMQLISIARNRTQIERGGRMGQLEDMTRTIQKGPEVREVEGWTGRRVTPERVVNVESPSRGRGQSMGRGAVGFFRPAIKESDPKQAPPPQVQQREVVIPDNVLRAQQEAEQRKLEQSLANERARLERDQDKEQRFQPPGTPLDEIRQRHAAERQAFEAHAAEQRQVLVQRFQKRIAKPQRADVNKQQKDNGNGKDKKKGDRGEG